ncbi:MAG: PAS domain S-box protein [Phormidesmis sp.]
MHSVRRILSLRKLANGYKKARNVSLFATVGLSVSLGATVSISTHLLSHSSPQSYLRQPTCAPQKQTPTAETAIQAGVTTPSILSLVAIAGLGSMVLLLWRYANERNRAVAAIAEQAELLRTTLSSIGDAVITTNGSGQVTMMNAIAESLTGWTSAEAKGRSLERVFNIVNEDTRQTVSNPAVRAIAQGTAVGLANHTILIAKDGSEIPIDDSAAPIFARTGEVIGCVLVFRDITERKQVDAEIREARSRLASTLAMGEIGTWEYEIANDAVWADRNLALMFEVSADERSGGRIESYLRAVHPEDRDRLTQVIRQAIATETFYEAEYRLLKSDGSVRWVVARGRIDRDGSGRAVQLPGVIVDITARKQAEARIVESEQQFRQIADAMPQMVWVAGPAGLNEYYNRRWREYVGSTGEELMGEGWSTPVHPDDRQRAIARWHQSWRTGEPYEIEYRLRAAVGEYRWFLVRALPVQNDQRQIVKWIGTCTDIEDFKRTQEERNNFVQLINNSSDFIAMSDLDGVPFYINPTAMRKIGLSTDAALSSIKNEDLFFPEDRALINDTFLPSVMAKGRDSIEIRFRHLQTGEGIWVVYNVVVLTNTKGEPIGFGTISQDITERRQMENNLRQLAANLSEADHRKDEFLATLAHELRNPLAPIRNGLQIMRRADTGSEAMTRIQAMMERQMTQMVRLIDDLLDMSRISRGKVDLRLKQVDLAVVIEAAVEAIRPAIEAAQHTLVVTLPPVPIYLNADAARLTQVFSNLLNNASKYSEPGGQIELSAKQEENEAIILVSDTGIGISEEMLSKIFDMFSQVEGSLSKSQGGLGIGLTLVKQLVEMHEGSVSAVSAGPGQGSEFVVRLPAIASPRPTTTESFSSEATTAGAHRILIVDDNEDSALTLSMLFEMTGDETQTAHDGQAAVEQAQTFRPDIVLLDIGLPKLNGYEAAREIRQQPWGQTMVLIALTGWGQAEDRRKSSEAGFDAHLVKPIDHDELLQLISELTQS